MNPLVWLTLTVNKAYNASQEEDLRYQEQKILVSKWIDLQDLEKHVKDSMKTLVVPSLAVRMALSAEKVAFSLSQELEKFAQKEILLALPINSSTGISVDVHTSYSAICTVNGHLFKTQSMAALAWMNKSTMIAMPTPKDSTAKKEPETTSESHASRVRASVDAASTGMRMTATATPTSSATWCAHQDKNSTQDMPANASGKQT